MLSDLAARGSVLRVGVFGEGHGVCGGWLGCGCGCGGGGGGR